MRCLSSLIISLFFWSSSLSAAKISEYIPKFKIENLKAYIEDKNIYYFQSGQGELSLNKNFKNHSMLNGPQRDTFYNVIPSKVNNKVLIEQDKNSQTILNIRKNKEIFLADIGDTKVTKIGEGQNPQFFDKWVVFLDLTKQDIHYLHLKTPNRIFSISFNTKINPYYIPQIQILGNTIYFTRIFEEGYEGVMAYDIEKKSYTQIYKDSTKGRKITLLTYSKSLFLMFSDEHIGITKLLTIYPTNKPIMQFQGVLQTNEIIGENILCVSMNKENYDLLHISLKTAKNQTIQSFPQYVAVIRQGEDFFINQQGKISKVTL